MRKDRIGYIDIAKALAMAFIIIGHTGLVFSADVVPGGMPSSIVQFAFTFHLPVFLVVSGYFVSESKRPTLDVLRKDARNLLLPYAVTCVLIILGCVAMAHSHGLSRKQELVRWLQASLWGAGARSGVALWDVERIGGIWFLPALFWARLLLLSTHRLNPWHRLLTLSSCTVMAAISARYVWLPLSIQSGIGCAVFLYLGMLARKTDAFNEISHAFLVLCALMWGYVIVRGGGMSLAMQVYPLGVTDVLGGLAATVCVVALAKALEAHVPRLSVFLQLVGRNTLPILCAHILEDNCLRWGVVGELIAGRLGAPWAWIALCLVRFCFDGLLVVAAYMLPGLREVFFAGARKASRSNRSR